MKLNYGLGEVSNSEENFFIISKNKKVFDYLIMVDSRGVKIDTQKLEDSFIYKLKLALESKNKSYIIISRPKNLTIIPTLINFLKLNDTLTFRNLITNLGFVDCTPKKQENIDDILLQIEEFSSTKNTIIKHEKYKLNNGMEEILKSIEYSQDYKLEVNNFLTKKFDKIFYINTPIVSKSLAIKRARPNSFFKQLSKTNTMISSLLNLDKKKNILVDIQNLNHMYDGVHYTEKGHEMIFNKIKQSISL